MFDPFTSADPPVLVHEVGAREFEAAWAGGKGDDQVRCPQCGQGHAEEQGVSEANGQAWIRFSCGDYVAKEITAG